MAVITKDCKKKIPQNVILKEICTVKEFIEDVGISYDSHEVLNDGSCIFLITGLEEEKISILKEMGFSDLGHNLFRFESNEIVVSEKMRYIMPSYISEEKRLWENMIDKIMEIERKCSSERKICPFKSNSILQIKIASKWTGNVVTDITKFKDFVTDLNSFFVDNLENKIEDKHKFHDFWRDTCALRHGYSHDTTIWRERDKMKIAQRTRKFFQKALGKDYPSTHLGFVKCQFTLLESCLDFLLGEI